MTENQDHLGGKLRGFIYFLALAFLDDVDIWKSQIGHSPSIRHDVHCPIGRLV